MAYWRDNADSYVCSACGYECNNPNKLPRGPGVCPSCQSIMISAGGINAPLTGWISVKDRLPEAGGYVACIAKRNPFSRFMPMAAIIEKNGWVNPITKQYISEVTHWMPLPEPPEEGTT